MLSKCDASTTEITSGLLRISTNCSLSSAKRVATDIVSIEMQAPVKVGIEDLPFMVRTGAFAQNISMLLKI